MGGIILTSPSVSHQAQALAYRAEHLRAGEPQLHGGALLDQASSYAQWLEQLGRNADESTVTPGWVPSSTYFAVRKSDSRIIGMIDIRHRLNALLRAYGGHIGFGIRPSERGKGYAPRILEQGLAVCRALPLDRVMLACYRDNLPSAKTICRCGGVLEREFLHSDGRAVQVYWIGLSAPNGD